MPRLTPTWNELERGLSLASGQRWTIVLPSGTEVIVAWPAAVIGALPADLAIVLDGTEQGPMEIAAANAEERAGVMHFRFSWREAGRPTTLSARAGGRTLVLWSDQIVTETEPIRWSGRLENWLGEAPAYALAQLEPGPGETFVAEARTREGQGGSAVRV